MINITINNVNVDLPANSTILQACNSLNIDVPKFCFQENLQIAGNCRMCLVEVKNSPKPVASCAMPIAEGMVVYTNTPLVLKARESVLEFLLINHPLDCPICDQAGECDLQDQTLNFGTDRSRFFFKKRSVEDKNCGPFIKTIMTRCIHCTRCVRFSQEVCGIDALGTTGRGNQTKISFYISKLFNSEFSGNVIDLCPVGALTAKPSAFVARSWELKKTSTLDVLDSIGSNINVQTFNNKVVRILPRINNNINIEWIQNKTRFFYDALQYQRLTKPIVLNGLEYKNIDWADAFKQINLKQKNIDGSQIKSLVGNFGDIDSLLWFKKLNNILGNSELNYNSKGQNFKINSDITNNFLLNNITNDVKTADCCLIINSNPRTEGSLLNLRLRNLVLKNNLQVYSIGTKLDLTFPVTNLGLKLTTLQQIIKGQHSFSQKLSNFKKIVVIVGSKTYTNNNIESLLEQLKNNYQNKITIGVLQLESGFINYLETNSNKIKPFISKPTKLLFLYNTNLSEDELNKYSKQPDIFIVYIGHHLTENAKKANLVLPCSTFFEKTGQYINTEGIIQSTQIVLKKSGLIKNDYSIFKYLVWFITNFKINKKKNNLILNNWVINYYIKNKNKNLQTISNVPLLKNNTFYTNKNVLNLFNSKNEYFLNNIFEKFSKILSSAQSKKSKISNNLCT